VKIQAVTFDVGGTLIEPWPSVGHVYAEVAERHGLKNISAEVLNTRFKSAWAAVKNFNHSQAGWEELVNLTFKNLVPGTSVPFFQDLYERFARADAWRIFDDVRPALAMLGSSGIRLGIVSNWDERLRGLLQQLGLADQFASIVVSCDIGAVKPSAMIFEHAAAKLELPPSAILHVGDSLEADVLGARSAGLTALRIRRGQEPSREDDLHSLTDLPSRLDQLSRTKD